MYLVIKSCNGRRTAYITSDNESAIRKMYALAIEKNFDKIVCIDMTERREEKCVNCMK